jgi:hypothetical protein
MDYISAAMGLSKSRTREDGTPGLALATFNKCGVPIGTPLIYDKSNYEDHLAADVGDFSVVANHFFPYRQNASIVGAHSVRATSLKIVDSKKLFLRKAIYLPEFDFDNLDAVIKSVKRDGAFSFILKDLSSILSFFDDLEIFLDYYPISAFLRHEGATATRSTNTDHLQLMTNIYDIKLCYPIFDYSKADGIGIDIITFWNEYLSGIGQSQRITAVLNSHTKNVLVVDGQDIAGPGFIHADYREHMKKDVIKSWKDKDKGDEGLEDLAIEPSLTPGETFIPKFGLKKSTKYKTVKEMYENSLKKKRFESSEFYKAAGNLDAIETFNIQYSEELSAEPEESEEPLPDIPNYVYTSYGSTNSYGTNS